MPAVDRTAGNALPPRRAHEVLIQQIAQGNVGDLGELGERPRRQDQHRQQEVEVEPQPGRRQRRQGEATGRLKIHDPQEHRQHERRHRDSQDRDQPHHRPRPAGSAAGGSQAQRDRADEGQRQRRQQHGQTVAQQGQDVDGERDRFPVDQIRGRMVEDVGQSLLQRGDRRDARLHGKGLQGVLGHRQSPVGQERDGEEHHQGRSQAPGDACGPTQTGTLPGNREFECQTRQGLAPGSVANRVGPHHTPPFAVGPPRRGGQRKNGRIGAFSASRPPTPGRRLPARPHRA